MAIIVCAGHSNRGEKFTPPGGKEYVADTDPLGYPNTAVICYIDDCENPGLVWLEKWELDALKNPPHRLVFPIEGGWSKVKI